MSADAAERLEQAYAAAGVAGVDVCEISPGRYEVTKPRSRQIISHQELCREIERLVQATTVLSEQATRSPGQGK